MDYIGFGFSFGTIITFQKKTFHWSVILKGLSSYLRFLGWNEYIDNKYNMSTYLIYHMENYQLLKFLQNKNRSNIWFVVNVFLLLPVPERVWDIKTLKIS